MPSFPSAAAKALSGSSSSYSSSPASSVRSTIISYARAILPSSIPESYYDFVPFLLAGLMALLFTALLVLLVEDSDDVYPHSARHSLSDSSSSSSSKREKRRIIGLAERDKVAFGDDDEEGEWASWDPQADLASSTSRNGLRMSSDWTRLQNDKVSASYRAPPSASRRLLAQPSPPASASPQSPAFTPPMLSMAKLIMHRHDQSSKRARASSRPSPPPSPPSSGNGMFGPMQYTLKSSTPKVSILALPSSDDQEAILSTTPTSSQSSSPSSSASTSPTVTSFSPDIEKAEQDVSAREEEASVSSTDHPTRRPTRHARSRSVVTTIHDSLSSLPGLVPALQLLQKQQGSSSERTVRRRPSSMLEEGSSPSEQTSETLSDPSQSEKRKKSRSRKRSGSKSKTPPPQEERRGSEGLVDLEEGSHGSS